MGVLDQLNRFVKNPTNLDISRSRFGMPFEHKCTMNSGQLVPIFCKEILPGDTFDVSVVNVTRMITPAVPVMDNAFMDTFFFFVPNRISCFDSKDWAKIHGENFGGAWAPSTESTLLSTGNMFNCANLSSGCAEGSALNHLGFPILSAAEASAVSPTLYFSCLPLNAYVKIWNEWFRDQNVQSPLEYYSASTLLSNINLTQGCLKVNKMHDYFTSCLPSPQKGSPVILPLGGLAPVVPGADHISVGANVDSMHFLPLSNFDTSTNKGDTVAYSNGTRVLGTLTQTNVLNGYSIGATVDVNNGVASVQTGGPVVPTNLYADLANATAASVNQIRQAFAIQRMLEKDARGGTRYREMLKAHFGVTIPDLTVQIPEYLGGKRIPLNITQVLQTSETNGTSALGGTGAFSNTSWEDRPFIKSFNEFGYLIGVACIRTMQTYSQGIEPHWSRYRRYDWYYPSFANLGEKPVYKRELYLKGCTSSALAESVFGYQEAWAEYRYSPSLVTGSLAPDSGDTMLTSWTYTNNFSSLPVLNSSFMEQPKSQIENTLAYSGNTSYQFICDFYFDVKATRPMPVFSIPGLIDHH